MMFRMEASMDGEMVIGIDPGPRESAFVVWDGERVVSCGDMLNRDLALHLDSASSTIACEWIESFGMSVGREVFETVFAVGVLSEHAKPFRLVPRRDVKLHLCASPRAKDGNIRQALIDRFGEVGTNKRPGPLFGISSHRWAALAVAVTAFDLPATDHEATFHVPESEPAA
jgi:hypothetical protein